MKPWLAPTLVVGANHWLEELLEVDFADEGHGDGPVHLNATFGEWNTNSWFLIALWPNPERAGTADIGFLVTDSTRPTSARWPPGQPTSTSRPNGRAFRPSLRFGIRAGITSPLAGLALRDPARPKGLRAGSRSRTRTCGMVCRRPSRWTTPAVLCTTKGIRCRFRPGAPIYPSGQAVRAAYGAERRQHQLATDQGKCNRLTWGGEAPWSHGPGKPGGRRLCYFDRNDAVIVWTHERRGKRATGTFSPSPEKVAATTRG